MKLSSNLFGQPNTLVCQERTRSKGAMPMISAKRLVQMAKKWQKTAAVATEGQLNSVASKGYCVVYSADGRRFEVPLAYLSMSVFSELLRQSQEEFGFSSDDGRITLPCDATTIEYVVCLLKRGASQEVENALLSSMVGPCNYGNNAFVETMGLSQRVAVSSF